MPDMSEQMLLLRKMGHDMRVPLNTLISTSDMMVDGVYDDLTPKQAKAAVRLQRNSRRLLSILDDFMTYIRADNGDMVLNPKPLHPHTKLDEWSSQVRGLCEEKGVKFHVATSDSVPSTVTVDELAVKRIVEALLWNAVAHTTQGDIQVTSSLTPKEEWFISVRDSGCGISDADLPHIFEPFGRGEQRPQLPTAGAGLGLPMALALSKLMGGKLFLKETTEHGSEFCVQLKVEKS